MGLPHVSSSNDGFSVFTVMVFASSRKALRTRPQRCTLKASSVRNTIRPAEASTVIASMASAILFVQGMDAPRSKGRADDPASQQTMLLENFVSHEDP